MKQLALVLVSITLCGVTAAATPCLAQDGPDTGGFGGGFDSTSGFGADSLPPDFGTSLGIGYPSQWVPLPTLNNPATLPPHLRLPTTATKRVLEDLSLSESHTSEEDPTPPETWLIPGAYTAGASIEPDVEVPLAEDKMILSFEPGLGTGIYDIVDEYNLRVLSASPETAQMTVQYDLGRYLKHRVGEDKNDALSRALVDAMMDYQSIPGVEIAAPSTFSFTEDEPRLEAATLAGSEVVSATEEVADWGIADIQADALWELNGASDGTIFGVFDVGFGKHADLIYLSGRTGITVDDHGTHVAGVACAKHNRIGVRGVLPNCIVKAVNSRTIFEPADELAANIQFVLVSLNEINQALIEFLDADSDARTFNVSLGANWRRLRISPETDPLWRVIISQQGATLARPLALAARSGKVIFSAAGNDSNDVVVQNSAYSSALNYAILRLREEGLTAGLIVAAHDKFGVKGPFSNAPADISCPGVDVLSTVAFDKNKVMSDVSYGLMTGTSMATPYCASGYALLSLVLPNLQPAELLRCMIDTGERSGTSIPRLKLLKAYEQCSGA